MSTETLYWLLPEMTLVIAATLIYIGGVFVPGRGLYTAIALGGLLLAGWTMYGQYAELVSPDMSTIDEALEPALVIPISDPLAVDMFSQYVRWLVWVVGLALILMAGRLAPSVQAPEYLGTLLLAIVGMMLVSSARELVLLFLGLELISIPTYILLYLGRRSVDSQEASAKYFYLSILSSAVMLYGFSFIYGVAGSTELSQLHATLASPDLTAGTRWLARLALVLVFAGLGFKVTTVPFHFYAPDVYQGTTAGNAALLSVLPKLGGLVALVRIVVASMPGFESYAWQIALVLALLTMTLGNVVALWQDNIRRLLAYSAIAHGGYMLMGLAVGCAAVSDVTGVRGAAGFDGIAAMLFYIAVYALATTGAFAVLVYLGHDDKSSDSVQVDNVDELAGLGSTHPWAALSMAIFMFSLTGIPPLAGFWGKLNLFAGTLSIRPIDGDTGATRSWFIALAIVGVLNAAISAGYYLRVVAVMYFRPATAESRSSGNPGAGLAMFGCALLVVFVGLVPNPLQQRANEASQSARLPSIEPAVDVATLRRQAPDHAIRKVTDPSARRASSTRDSLAQAVAP
ncbi:MAG TPA: NADH-quinone oxidoreductase subunit N [Pirellulales bacterium]